MDIKHNIKNNIENHQTHLFHNHNIKEINILNKIFTPKKLNHRKVQMTIAQVIM